MVKQGSSSFLATSVAKGSIVLSKAIEQQLALKAEISDLRHHFSVLSKRLHSVILEKQILEDIVKWTVSGEMQPLDDEEVAEDEATPRVAGEEMETAIEIVASKEVESATEVVAGEEVESAREVVAGEEVESATDVVAGKDMESATEVVPGEEESDRVP